MLQCILLLQILLLMDLAAVGEALVWCKRGDIHLDCRLKAAGYLFNMCLDQMKRGKKQNPSQPPYPSCFPASVIKIVVKNLRDEAPQAKCLCSPQGCYFLTPEAASQCLPHGSQPQGRNNAAHWARRCPRTSSPSRGWWCPLNVLLLQHHHTGPGWEPGNIFDLGSS